MGTFFHEILINFWLILRNEKNIIKRFHLLYTYKKLYLKYLLFVKLLKIRPKDEKIFSYKFKFADYETLRFVFEEVFIQKCYKFKTDNKNPVIIDCGAHIGLSVLNFKLNYPNSIIIGFEPNEIVFNILKENITGNNLKDVELVNAAVYNKETTLNLYLDSTLKGSPHSSIHKQEVIGKMHESKCKTVLLSSYINGYVDFLKMDIEGAECEVIEELAQKQKLKYVKQMGIEFHYLLTDDYYATDGKHNNLSKLLEILENNNFEYIISSFKRPPLYEYTNKPYNLLIYACKNEKVVS